MRIKRLSVLLVAVALLSTACGGGDDGSTSSQPGGTAEQKQYRIKVGTLRQPHLFAPAFYEKFLPANVKMETVLFANSTEIDS